MIPKIIRLGLMSSKKDVRHKIPIFCKIVARSSSLSESESEESEDDYDYGPMRFKVESKLNVKRLLQVTSTPE